MGYNLEWAASPNFTPGAQTQQFYGRPRVVTVGAGHWWGDPNAGYSHQGVVNGFLNAARQVAAHAVVSAGRVTEMVRPGDTAWCTSSANPYSYAIEVDPRIYLGGALADQIKETLAEYIADRPMAWFGDLLWKPHNQLDNSTGTQCNPLDWPGIRARAEQIYNDKHAPATPEWQANLKKLPANVTMYAIDDNTPLRNLANTPQVIKNFTKATPLEIAAETRVGNYRYLLTQYAYANGTGQGFDEYELQATDPNTPAPQPEWIRNLQDIAAVKLMVLPAQTPVVDLNTLAVIKQLGQGTWVDFSKKTTVGGVEYLISSYSATNAMPNGIASADVGLPVTNPEPPVDDRPEWVKNWQDIADVTMYTRVDAQLVNLLDGSTIKTIPRGTAVEIASASDWHGQHYLISKYATDTKAPNGILVIDLSDKPLEANPDPVEPAPEQPDLGGINNRLNILELFMQAIKDLLAKIGIKL